MVSGRSDGPLTTDRRRVDVVRWGGGAFDCGVCVSRSGMVGGAGPRPGGGGLLMRGSRLSVAREASADQVAGLRRAPRHCRRGQALVAAMAGGQHRGRDRGGVGGGGGRHRPPLRWGRHLGGDRRRGGSTSVDGRDRDRWWRNPSLVRYRARPGARIGGSRPWCGTQGGGIARRRAAVAAHVGAQIRLARGSRSVVCPAGAVPTMDHGGGGGPAGPRPSRRPRTHRSGAKRIRDAVGGDRGDPRAG